MELKKKLLNVEFDTIKTKEMKQLEKIKKIGQFHGIGYRDKMILSTICAYTSDAPLYMTLKELSELCNVGTKTFYHCPLLSKYGLVMVKKANCKFEISVEVDSIVEDLYDSI